MAAFGGTHGWGYDGVAPYAVHQRVRRPGRLPAVRRRVPRPRPRRVPRRRLQPPRSGRQLPRRPSGRTSPTPTRRRGAPPSTSTPTAATRCGAGSSTTPCGGSATSTSTRFGSMPCTSSATTPSHTSSPSCPTRPLLSLSELGRPLDLIAESDLNDPVMVTPTAEGGRGMTAQWADDVHHALHVALTGETQGYYADFAGGTEAWPRAAPSAVLAKTLTEVFLHDGGCRPSGASTGARRSTPARARGTVRRLPADPRPGRQPRGR